MWKLKDDSDCPVDFPGNWGYYNMDTQSLDTDDDGTLIQDSFRINLFDFDWLELLANKIGAFVRHPIRERFEDANFETNIS